MAGPSGLKLGWLVEGMCPNFFTKDFIRSVNGCGKMAAKRQEVAHLSDANENQYKCGEHQDQQKSVLGPKPYSK